MGLRLVPELAETYVYQHEGGPILEEDGALPKMVCDDDKLTYYCNELSTGPSNVDPSHIIEGVCVRVEHQDCMKTFKYKSFSFCHLEGIRKNSDDYIDIEEVS